MSFARSLVAKHDCRSPRYIIWCTSWKQWEHCWRNMEAHAPVCPRTQCKLCNIVFSTRLRNPCVDCHRRLACPSQHAREPAKGGVYVNRPWTLQDLQNNIKSEIQAITPETLHRTFRNMERHVQACLEAQGAYFQHLLWRSCVQHETRYVSC
jgi:hypothetical protein